MTNLMAQIAITGAISFNTQEDKQQGTPFTSDERERIKELAALLKGGEANDK